MSHGHNISPFGGNRTNRTNDNNQPYDPESATDVTPTPFDPKENSGTLFTRQWQNGQAVDLRDFLLTILSQNDPNFLNNSTQTLPTEAEQAARVLTQTWETIINNAQNHPAFENFQDQPAKFWDDVQQMSEIRVVEKYVNGTLEPRVESDYGSLLRQFDNHGGNLQTFVASLPSDKGKVFQARYQINQTFGANELFVGKGVALDKNGQFPVRVFLAGNGESLNLPPHSVLSLVNDLSAESSFFKNYPIFANGQILLTAKSAALLSLSLSLYQNTNARVALGDLADEFSARTLNIANQNSFEKPNLSLQQKNNFVTAALVSGALTTLDKSVKFGRKIGSWTNGEGSALNAQNFSVGATGAIMGAALGCLVPLAEKNAGEIIGFAASVVAGLNNAGMRMLCATTMNSVISGGAQNILNAANNREKLKDNSANRFLNVPKPAKFSPENDLRQTLLSHRMKALLSS